MSATARTGGTGGSSQTTIRSAVSENVVANDDGTMPPPSSNRGEVTLITADVALSERAQAALRGAGFWILIAEDLSKLPVTLPTGVLVLDPGDDRLRTRTILEVLARVPTRPTVVLIIRAVEDLSLAAEFRIGALEVNRVQALLVDAVDRARQNGRHPRLPHQ